MGKFATLSIAPDPVQPVDVPFGEWLPDMPEENNPGAIEALNVIPGEGGYTPFKQLSQVGTLALPDECVGAVRAFALGGEAVLYAGTVNGVYLRVIDTFTSLYAAPSPLFYENQWQFIPFGDVVVSFHPQVAPLVGDVGGALPLSPLGGSPPIARTGARVGDFLVLGNIVSDPDDGGAEQPRRIRWSGQNNIEAPWISDPATQADFQDMPADGGAVMAITGREFGSIFQERCISRMTYQGLPLVFDIETVETSRGAISIGSVVDIGGLAFYIAEDGFFVWNGTSSVPIGDNKVNRWFFRRLNWRKRNRISSAVDYVNSVVMWAFPTIDSDVATPGEIIAYSYKENKFSHALVSIETLLSGTPFGVPLDTMDGDLDSDYPISFDDNIYLDGRSTLAGFGMAHEFGLFNGANMAATLDTAESSGPGGRRVQVSNTRPIIDVTEARVSVSAATRDQFSGQYVEFSAATIQERDATCPVIAEGRYMRFRATVPANIPWNHARGVQVFRVPTGAV